MALDDHNLDAGAQSGTQDLTAVIDADKDELEVLGYAMSFTVGDFEVPREWVVDRMDELGLPDWMVPRRPTPKRSYNRVRNRLTDEGGDNTFITFDGQVRMAKVKVKKVNKATFQIDADIMYEADEIEDDDDGQWKTETLGKVKYNYDDQAIMTIPEITSESDLWDVWTDYAQESMDEFDYYKNVHLGGEFQRTLNRMVNDWTNSVMMRDGGAYYFVPAKHKDTLDNIATLFREMNTQFKDSGRRLEIKTIPVINDDQRQEMVRREAENEIETQVASAVDEIESEIEDAQQSSDTEVDDVVDDIVDVFEDQLDEIDNFAAEYNALLEAELGVREVLEDRRGDVVPEADDILADVLE